MHIPNFDQFADFKMDFSKDNPGMNAIDNPMEYLIYWNARINIINAGEIIGLRSRLSNIVASLDEQLKRITQLEDKMRK